MSVVLAHGQIRSTTVIRDDYWDFATVGDFNDSTSVYNAVGV